MGLSQKSLAQTKKNIFVWGSYESKKTGKQNWRGALYLRLHLIEQQCGMY